MVEVVDVDIVEASESERLSPDEIKLGDNGRELTPAQERYAANVQHKLVKGIATDKDLAFYEDMVNNSNLHAAKIFKLLDDIEDDVDFKEDLRVPLGHAKLHIELKKSIDQGRKSDSQERRLTMKDINGLMKSARQAQAARIVPPVDIDRGNK